MDLNDTIGHDSQKVDGSSEAVAVGDPRGITTPDADADKAFDEAADKFFGEVFEDEPQTPEEESGATDRGADGRFKAKKETESEEDREEGKTEDSKSSETDPEYEKALQALKRAKTPENVLKDLDADGVKEWGLTLAEQQAEQDRFSQRISELETKLTKDSDDQHETASDSGKDEPDVSLDAVIEPFSETFGEEFAEPLRQFGQGLRDQIMKDVVGPMKEQLRQQQHEQARSKLSDKYSLEDQARWQKVLTRRSADRNDHPSEVEALEAACRLEFADEIISQLENKQTETRKARSTGQSATSKRGKAPETAGVSEEDQIIGAILNDDYDTVYKVAKRRPHRSMLQAGSS